MSSRRHKWPRCRVTGKQRLGERKDARLVLRAARHTRSKSDVAGGDCRWTVVRAYKCDDCGGFHLTSLPSFSGMPRPDSA